MELIDYLNVMVQYDASDLFLLSGATPSIKVNNQVRPISQDVLDGDALENLAFGIMTPEQIDQFHKNPELNTSLADHSIGRFRVNVFKQCNDIAMVIRNIKTEIPDMDDLGLPSVLKELIMQNRGLILFVGATGMGKSTSLASLINYRNTHSASHIITIEDPIEYMHSHKKSLISQREVGVDTESYQDALKNTLRQAPNVIMIGEIRTSENMEHAVTFAETGHICLSTLHANNANQALDRILHFFPSEKREQVLMDLSLNLAGIISQRLVKTKDGSQTAVFEILLGTPLVSDLIRRFELTELKDVMEKSEHLGMQTFDKNLLRLYEDDVITLEEALRHADSQNNLRLAISLKNRNLEEDAKEFTLQGDEDTSGSWVR